MIHITQRLDKELIFQGLSKESIKYLRLNGLWMPVSQDLLNIDEHFSTDTCQLYGRRGNELNLLTIIIEQGEFLVGSVYDTIDFDRKPSTATFLHQYVLENGSLIREKLQLVYVDIVFLELVDSEDKLISCWNDEDVERTVLIN